MMDKISENIKFTIPTPKQSGRRERPRDQIYPFYAGFSRHFADTVIEDLTVRGYRSVIDPWNGSGTVTLAAKRRNFTVSGIDINPVMVLVAKSRLVSHDRVRNAINNAIHSLSSIKSNYEDIELSDDPLRDWFDDKSVFFLRTVVRALQIPYLKSLSQSLSDVSAVRAFVAIILFRSVRQLLRPFFTTNPTWIKRAIKHESKISISRSLFANTFKDTGEKLYDLIENEPVGHSGSVRIALGRSTALPFNTSSFDACITSPPYCTRIDYVVATLPELALISSSSKLNIELRSEMLGTTIVPSDTLDRAPNWGPTCNKILDKVQRHPSKASHTYYYKTLVGYFKKLYDSLGEIARVIKNGGVAVVVVQGSFYKDVLIDLPVIIDDMFTSWGLVLIDSVSYHGKQNFAIIHRGRHNYPYDCVLPEVALWFKKL